MALVYNDRTGDFEDIPIPPVIRSFKVLESPPIYQGDNINLQWQVDDALHVYINDEEQSSSRLTKGQLSVGENSFVLKASNADGTSNSEINVEVFPTPKFNVNCSATILREGQNENVVFNWKISDAIKLSLRHDNTFEELPLEGCISFSPDEDTAFDFAAEGIEGGRIFHHIIPIKIRKAANIKFTASRMFSYPNLPIRISWEVENASFVSIDSYGVTNKKGFLDVSPGEDTTYTLRVRDAFGEEQRTLTIRMLPLPVIKQIFTPAPQIEKDLAIAYIPPKVKINVPVPTLKSSLIDINLPEIPRLRNSPHFVSLLSKKKKSRSLFKSLFSYFQKTNRYVKQ